VSRALLRGDGGHCEYSRELDLKRAASTWMGGTAEELAKLGFKEDGNAMGAWWGAAWDSRDELLG
jgi:hypothetical protein